MDLDKLEVMDTSTACKAVCKNQERLWRAQAEYKAGKMDWLQGTATARAAKEEYEDWEQRMREMVQMVEKNSILRPESECGHKREERRGAEPDRDRDSRVDVLGKEERTI